MGPGFGFGPPPNREMNEKLKEPRPRSLREVPAYVKNTVSKTAKRLAYIFKLVWGARPSLLVMMMFMTIFNGVTPVIYSFLLANILNGVASAIAAQTAGQAAELSLIATPLIIMLVFQVIKSIVININTIMSRLSSELVTNEIKKKIMNKATEIDLADFDMPDFYERLENANREAGMRPIQVLNSFFSMFSTLITLISFIVVLATASWWSPLVIIVISVPSAIINFNYRKKNFNYMRRRSRDRREMSYCSDMLVNKDMVKEVKLFGLSDFFIDRYNNVFKRYFAGIKKLIVGEGVWNISISAVTTAVNFGLLFLFANMARTGFITEIGDYSIYTGALDSIAGGIASLIATTATIYEGTLFIDNMILFMNEKRQIVPAAEVSVPVTHGICHTIEFKNVSFKYPGVDRYVLKNINVTIKAGETAVLVGLNGAGKTTFIKLLTRLYDPTEGTIELDGRDIRLYDPDELYSVFGIIFQDFGKYAFSVEDNIVFGNFKKGKDTAKIEDAAVRSGAKTFIDLLPKGYETPLMRYFEQDGIELSIGQWQKLSIARAFYSDSDILILDEPTASLDPMAEQEVFNRFDSLRGNKTTLFVSHRLSSATKADRILVMKDGQIIENGNHAMLMAAKGEYYTLFSAQAKRYISSENEQLYDGLTHKEPSHNMPQDTQFHHDPAHRTPSFGTTTFDMPSQETPNGFAVPFGIMPEKEITWSESNTVNNDRFNVPFGVIPEKEENK